MDEEMLKKARTAKSAEELSEMAKAENIALSKERAEEIFSRINSQGEITDEELDAVSGGCGSGHTMKRMKAHHCPRCYTPLIYKDAPYYCPKCKQYFPLK